MLAVALSRADAARGAILRALGPVSRLIVPREARAAAWGVALLSVSLALTGLVPMWLLALGPIVWGVPHVLSDVRYLVVRTGDHRRAGVALPVLAGLGLAAAGYGLRAALSGIAIAVLLSGAPLARRLAVTCGVLLCFALVHAAPREAALAFAHGHNLVALAFFAAWPGRDRGRAARLAPLAVAALGIALALSGALDGAMLRAHPLGSLRFDDLAATLAPADLLARLGAARPGELAGRLTLSFAFAQAAHYVVWLRLVPELARPSPTPRSFRQTYRALSRELGRVVLFSSALAALVFAVWATIDLATARTRYLEVAFFHGYLELAAAALFLSRGGFAVPARARVGEATA